MADVSAQFWLFTKFNFFLFFRYVYTYARPKKEKDSDDEESSDEEDEEEKGECEYQRKIWVISRLGVEGLEQQTTLN